MTLTPRRPKDMRFDTGQLFDRVSDGAAIRLGHTVGVVSMVSAAASVIIFLAIGELETWYIEWGVHNVAGGFLFGLLLFVAVGATNARVGVAGRNGDLVTEFDLGTLSTDLDLRDVSDRIDAAGGKLLIKDGALTIDSIPWSGTVITGMVPINPAAVERKLEPA